MIEKRILDEATRKLLEGYVPFSVNSTVNFTPNQFNAILDESLRPIFCVRSFKQSEIQELKKNYASYDSTKPETVDQISETNLQIVRGCVMGWRNLFDAGTGGEIIYKTDPSGGCEKSIWETFPVWLVRELMDYIRKISGLTAVEELGLK